MARHSTDPTTSLHGRRTLEHDWRLNGQEWYLTGMRLTRKVYSPKAGAGSDHDHCEFCGAKFMSTNEPGVAHEGYCTDDDYRWICVQCFDDFRGRFLWIVD
jgi:hypothetical protein